MYRVHHGKVWILYWLKWVPKCKSDFFWSGFEILRLDIVRQYNEFTRNGYCAPSIRDNVRCPQFNLFFVSFLSFLIVIFFTFFVHTTQKLLKKKAHFIIPTFWLVFEAFLQFFVSHRKLLLKNITQAILGNINFL